MGKRILIIGGGTGELVAANKLRKALSREHEIILESVSQCALELKLRINQHNAVLSNSIVPKSYSAVQLPKKNILKFSCAVNHCFSATEYFVRFALVWPVFWL